MSTSKGTAVERIRSLQTQLEKDTETLKGQIQTEMDNVKVELATQLDAACQTYKTLIELGATDVLSEPKYSEFIRLFGVGSQNGAKAAKRGRKPGRKPGRKAGVKTGPRKGKTTTADAILVAMKSGSEMDIASIMAKASEAKGKKISSPAISQTLLKLKKDKKVLNPSRGMWKIK